MHTKFQTENENAFVALLKVNCHIAYENEVHTIGGKPCWALCG